MMDEVTMADALENVIEMMCIRVCPTCQSPQATYARRFYDHRENGWVVGAYCCKCGSYVDRKYEEER